MNSDKQLFVEWAKFIQNLLLEKNIKCYLIGGALINAVRDDGVLKTDDIDFAILEDENLNFSSIKDLISDYFLIRWWASGSSLSIVVNNEDNKRIDFLKFNKKYLNYYIDNPSWIHEKICHFQTFKEEPVVLEGKTFLTMHRPDLFLKTVYGDYSVTKEEYVNLNGGDTGHLQECFFYANHDDYSKIDFKVENLKLFFKSVVVKRNAYNIQIDKINIFDSSYNNLFDNKKFLFYKDFTNFLVKNNVNFDDF